MNDYDKSYEARFLSFSIKMERLMVMGMIGFALLLFVIQILFTSATVRSWFVTTDRLEGTRISDYNVNVSGR